MKVVTQETSSTTAVTCNSKSGQINTVAVTTAQNGSFEFVVNNDQLYDDNSIILGVQYDGTGEPRVSIVSRDRFTFTVRVYNNAGTAAALDGSVGVLFQIAP